MITWEPWWEKGTFHGTSPSGTSHGRMPGAQGNDCHRFLPVTGVLAPLHLGDPWMLL